MTSISFNEQSIPVIKATVQRNDFRGNIFLRTSARVTEIEKGTIYHTIVNLIDGKKTVGAIVKAAIALGFAGKEAYRALAELDELLLLEDSTVPLADLSQTEIDRWARNLNFFGSFCHFGESKSLPQQKIRDCKVTLLGLGGLGSHLLFDLAAIGCKDILAVEFDNVEISNLNRQILYGPADIGRPKAEVAKERIMAFSPDLKFEVYNRKIESAADVTEAITGRDIAICVADRPKTEILYWVNEACVNAGVPLITGGLDTKVARYYCTLPNKGCLECWRASVKENDPNANAILEEQRRTQLRGDNAAFVPFVALIAGLMITEFTKIITGIGGAPNAHNRTREIDFSAMEIKSGEAWSRNPACSCCAERSLNWRASTLVEA